jgi:hypothetical protein
MLRIFYCLILLFEEVSSYIVLVILGLVAEHVALSGVQGFVCMTAHVLILHFHVQRSQATLSKASFGV